MIAFDCFHRSSAAVIMSFRPERAARSTERDPTGFRSQARWNFVACKSHAPLRSSTRELFQWINSELLELLHRLFEACPQAIHSVASPSPRPLPWGEGESPAAFSPIQGVSIRGCAGCGVPCPPLSSRGGRRGRTLRSFGRVISSCNGRGEGPGQNQNLVISC